MIDKIACGNLVIKFNKIKTVATKNGVCQICGKKCKRSKTFERHISCFNLNEDGTRKTPEQIKSEIDTVIGKWKDEPTNHKECIKSKVRNALDVAELNYIEHEDTFEVCHGATWSLTCDYEFETGKWRNGMDICNGSVEEFIESFTQDMEKTLTNLMNPLDEVHVNVSEYGKLKKAFFTIHNHTKCGEVHMTFNGVGATSDIAIQEALNSMPSELKMTCEYSEKTRKVMVEKKK
jgi:hypothetical protein